MFLLRVSVVLITGYYLYIETSTGLIGNKAILISPQFQQAYSTCQLKFSYHMYGSTIGSLTVYLNDGVSRTRMWSLGGLFASFTGYKIGLITSRCPGKEPALQSAREELRPDSRKRRKSSLGVRGFLSSVSRCSSALSCKSYCKS